MQRLVLALVTAASLVAFTLASRSAAPPKARIGTYDSRAIAIAYAPSKHNPVAEKMKEYEAAKAKGDTQRAKELEAWGTTHQRQLHRQGFARVPVDDLLAHVADRLPEVAKAAGVEAIVFGCNHHTADIELVDVTLAIVALYEPSEQTLEYVRSAMKAEPVALDTIDKLKD
jgi:hypothetical protein